MLRHILFLFTIFVMFCSCTKQNNIETITFSSWGSITEVKILNDLIKDFEKKNPDIKVNFMHIPQNYFQKMHLLFASSTAPDVIFINNLYLPVYSKHLDDLSDYIPKDNFYKQAIEALSIDDKLYAVPRDISNLVFYYNKYIIGNLDNNWEFSDLDKFLQKKLKNNLWNISYERDIFYAMPFIMTLGYNDGIQYYKNLEGIAAPMPSDIGSQTSAQMFIDGKIGLYLSGRWMYPKIKESAKFPYGIIAFPGFVPADASGWAISKSSKHKLAAIRFLMFISSKDSINYFTGTGLIVPARIDCANAIEEKAFLDAIKKSKYHKVDKDYNKTRDRLNKQIFN